MAYGLPPAATRRDDDVMGAWGTAPFENDDAGDWVYELEETGDFEFVRRALAAVLETDDYLELAEGSNAVGAAAIVAASLDGSRDGLSEEVVAWIDEVADRATVDDARLATLALDRVTAEESEAAALWQDSTSAREWFAVVEALRRRLARPSG
jgi:hypothetical protein